MTDDFEIPSRWAWLVIDPNGGLPLHGTADRDRAYELARNTGCWVTRLPVYTDSREEAQWPPLTGTHPDLD